MFSQPEPGGKLQAQLAPARNGNPRFKHGRGLLAVVLGLASSLLVSERAAGQKLPPKTFLPPPQLHVLSPRGAKAGTTVEITLTGVSLESVESLVFSQPGIKAEQVKAPPLPPPDPKKKKGPKPLPRTDVKFKVTVPPNTPFGIHDVRVVTKGGISNPRAFVIGDLQETTEKEPNSDIGQAQRVDLNTTINGVIDTPGDVDYFVFRGKKGQRVVVSCLTTSIDSNLPAALELYDSKDRQLAFNRNYQGNDALTDCTLPADGDYFVRLYGFTYTLGGPNFFYRLSISTAPWIDAIYPPMVEPGKKATLTVFGRNLPGGKLDPTAVVDGRVLEKITITIDVPNDPSAAQRLGLGGHVPAKSSALDGFFHRVKNDSGTSNPFLLTYATAPIVLDNQSNDSPENAQEVTPPCEIAGRIQKKNDRDWYTLAAKKGDVFSIEAYADRLGAPIDLFMILRDAKSKRVIIELDDNLEILNRLQFFTRSDDPPRYRFKAPADGKYQIMVSSREANMQWGPRDYYRLRITAEQPDFRLVVMPASHYSAETCTIRPGRQQDYSVFVWRRDGWNGSIKLDVDGLPQGVLCAAQTIGPGIRETSLFLKAAPDAPHWTGTIRVRGSATIAGKTVVREARPATITWPVPFLQNVATISRLDRELALAVREPAPFSLDAGISEIEAKHGTRITIPLKLTRLRTDFKGQVRVLTINQPGKLNFQPVILSPGRDQAKLAIFVPNNMPPGRHILVLRGYGLLAPGKRVRGRQAQFFVQSSGPIAVTVVPRSLATVSLSPAKLKLKPGSQAEIEVRINNRYDFSPENYKIQLVFQGQANGVTAQEITIPAGQDRGKLNITISEDAQPGKQIEAQVVATALIGKTAIKQSARLNVVILKP